MRMASVIEDMLNLPAPDEEGVGQELPVTAPGDGLGAHQGRSVLRRDRQKPFHDSLELGSQQEVRIGSKSARAPGGVGRVRGGPAVPAEVSAPYVIDAGGFERRSQLFPAKMRVTLRGWPAPDIQDEVDSMGRE
jgi:hypothetical protein